MKYVFMDIDGVLNHEKFYCERKASGEELQYPLGEFDPECVERVNRILSDCGARLVLSSSWRLDGAEITAETFGKVGLPTDFDMTPVLRRPAKRGEEIQAFLDTHPCEGYVILDDDQDMLETQLDNFVKCDDRTGLDELMTADAIGILNGTKRPLSHNKTDAVSEAESRLEMEDIRHMSPSELREAMRKSKTSINARLPIKGRWDEVKDSARIASIANDRFSGKKTEGEMEIHFLTDFCPEGCLMTYDETEDAIRRRERVINTTSMAHLSFWLNDAGYKVFVHRNGKKIEFKPGMDNPMGKDIRKENNVFKMFKAKFFDDMF